MSKRSRRLPRTRPSIGAATTMTTTRAIGITITAIIRAIDTMTTEAIIRAGTITTITTARTGIITTGATGTDVDADLGIRRALEPAHAMSPPVSADYRALELDDSGCRARTTVRRRVDGFWLAV